MTRSTSRFASVSRAATTVGLLASGVLILIGIIAEIPWMVGIFTCFFLAILAIVPWVATSNAACRPRR